MKFTLFMLLSIVIADSVPYPPSVKCAEEAVFTRPNGIFPSGSGQPPADPTYLLRWLYFVPSDQNPRPQYEEEIIRLSKSLRKFFGVRLGRTFKYSDRLLELVLIPLTTQEIISGSQNSEQFFDTDGEPDISKNVIQTMIEYINNSTDLSYERYTLFMGHSAIFEIPEWCARGGTGLASHCGQEFDRFAMSDIEWWIYPFDHEYGHLFGLSHTDIARSCLAARGIETPDQNTIMTQPPQLTFDWGWFAEYEREMLTNATHLGVECLGTLGYGWWPHPVNYLTECVNNLDVQKNGKVDIDDLATLLVNWGPCKQVLCSVDFDCNSMVNVDDLAAVLVNWNQSVSI